MIIKFPYLNIDELNSPDIGDGCEYMNTQFLLSINFIGSKLGHKLKINSGYRTAKHNSIVGGVKTSSYRKGLAVDIAIKTSNERYIIILYALQRGISRIGIYRNFIHLDIDGSKPQKVIWYK